jgi:hypothetical protein
VDNVSVPDAIAAGADGNLWFTLSSEGRIGRITTAGKVTEFSAGITPGSGPFAIAAGPDGNMWFTMPDEDRLGRITPAGQVTEFSAGITPGSGPSAIAAGADGNMWFTESSGNRIGRITTTVGPQVAILTRRARASPRGVTRLELSGGPGTGLCAGRLHATATVRVRQPIRGTKRFRTVAKTIVAGRGQFSIPTGRQATVTLTLSISARRRLARSKQRRLSTELRAISTGGDARRRLTLTAP